MDIADIEIRNELSAHQSKVCYTHYNLNTADIDTAYSHRSNANTPSKRT